DSNRCISYLTIEHRGRIPAARERDLGEWIFGCDICQEVCPWNRKIAPAEDPAFITDPRLEHETLADVVRLDDASFAERFAGTALARTRRQGMVRNALIVAANTGDGRALDAAGGGYRNYAVRPALHRCRLVFVRNLPDGRVEAVAAGRADDIAAFIATLRQGPAAGRVDGLETGEATLEDTVSRFEIRN